MIDGRQIKKYNVGIRTFRLKTANTFNSSRVIGLGGIMSISYL